MATPASGEEAKSSDFAFSSLFGAHLLRNDDEVVDTDTVLGGKDVVGIYFSSAWCGPCKRFTPKLKEVYEVVTGRGDAFEIVLVSKPPFDEFDEYRRDMPWLAMPCPDEAAIAAGNGTDSVTRLVNQFKAIGIPSLALLDGRGEVLTLSGRYLLGADSEGTLYPWRAQPVLEQLGNVFVRAGADGANCGREAIEGKYVMYFTGAREDGDECQEELATFKSRLTAWSHHREQEGKDDFVVVYGGHEKTQEARDAFVSDMPDSWLTIPWEDAGRRIALAGRLEIMVQLAYPNLAVVAPDGEIVSLNATDFLQADPRGKHFPYAQPLCCDLSVVERNYGWPFHKKPGLMLFMENEDDLDQEALIERAVNPVARDYAESKKDQLGGPDMLFWCMTGPGRTSTNIRSMLNLPPLDEDDDPLMAIVNMRPNGDVYVCSTTGDDELTEEAVRAFVVDFFEGNLTPIPKPEQT